MRFLEWMAARQAAEDAEEIAEQIVRQALDLEDGAVLADWTLEEMARRGWQNIEHTRLRISWAQEDAEGRSTAILFLPYQFDEIDYYEGSFRWDSHVWGSNWNITFAPAGRKPLSFAEVRQQIVEGLDRYDALHQSRTADLALSQPERYYDIPEGSGHYFETFFPLDTRETMEGEERFEDLDLYAPRGREDDVLFPEEFPFTDEPGDYPSHGFEEHEAEYGHSLRELTDTGRPSSILDAMTDLPDAGMGRASSIRVSARHYLQKAGRTRQEAGSVEDENE